MFAVFAATNKVENSFIRLADNQDEIDKYKIIPDYITYEFDFDDDILNAQNYKFSLDDNNNVKYILISQPLALEAGFIKYGFIDRMKFLFTGKIPEFKGKSCH